MTLTPMTAESTRQTEPGSLAGVRVILVDDEPDGRTILGTVLGLYGAEVRMCESAEEARAAILAEPRSQLLISDIGMPRESGLDLMRSIRAMECGRTVPAIALTGYDQDSLRVETLEAGYDRHVAKPVDPTELILLATTLLASRRVGPQNGDVRPI